MKRARRYWLKRKKMRREEKVFNLCFFGEISGVINLRIKDFEFEAFLGVV